MPILVCLRSSCIHVTKVGCLKVCETRAEGCHAKLRGLCVCNPAIHWSIDTNYSCICYQRFLTPTGTGTTVRFQKWSSCTYTDCRTTGLLTVSQYASGRFCGHLARSRFSVGFLDRRAVAELVPRLHVASIASHASLHAITLLPSQYLITYLLTYLLTYSMKQSPS